MQVANSTGKFNSGIIFCTTFQVADDISALTSRGGQEPRLVCGVHNMNWRHKRRVDDMDKVEMVGEMKRQFTPFYCVCREKLKDGHQCK